MTRLRLSLALLLSVFMSAPLSAQDDQKKVDKIATIDMQRLINSYYRAGEVRDSFKVHQESLQGRIQERLDVIKALDLEAEKLQKQADDPSLDAEKKGAIFQQATLKQRQSEFHKKQHIEWIKQKQAALSERGKMEFGKLRKEVMEVVQAKAKSEGYDFVFDRSAASGAGVLILSYTKDFNDLTGYFIELLNKKAPEKKEEEPKKEGE